MAFGNLKVDTITTSTRTIIVDDFLVGGANVVTFVQASGVGPIQVSGGPIVASGTLEIGLNQSALSIAPSQLTSGALPSGVTVASGNIIDGTIVDADINNAAGIAPSKIAGTAVVSGDSRLTDQRVPTDGSVTNAKVASGAAIDLGKLATGALPSGITVASTNIIDGTIVDADINASASIALTKLANGTLPSGIAIASGTQASTNLSYDNALRTLGSSTGSGITLPIVTSGNPGLAPTASGGTDNFLRADGTWAAVSGATNLSYDSGTRVLSSSTGSGVTLPLVTSSTAGLQPASGYDTISYAAQVTIDFSARDRQINTISLTGNLELLSSNLANGREVRLRLVNDATQRTLTFPSDWKFVGAKPANIAVSKVAILSLAAFGTTNANVVAAYAVQS